MSTTDNLRELVRSDEARWRQHLATCQQCAAVMDSLHRKITDLCHEGGLAFADLGNSRSGLRASIALDRQEAQR